MDTIFLIIMVLFFAIQAMRARRLIVSSLWLAGVSALVSLLLYRLGAPQVAVIELSVGAGLVTVLFVFAISIAGETVIGEKPIVPILLVSMIVLLAMALLGWMILPNAAVATSSMSTESSLATVLWQQRGLDVLVQIVLIFAGVLGLLGLLAEKKAPLEGSMAAEVAARRDRELQALQHDSLVKQEELV